MTSIWVIKRSLGRSWYIRFFFENVLGGYILIKMLENDANNNITIDYDIIYIYYFMFLDQ